MTDFSIFNPDTSPTPSDEVMDEAIRSFNLYYSPYSAEWWRDRKWSETIHISVDGIGGHVADLEGEWSVLEELARVERVLSE